MDSAPDTDDDADQQGSVEMEVTSVPTGVQCIKLVINVGSQTITPAPFAVTAGSAANLSLGLLPSGAATFNGNAYNLACASVTTTTAPNWVADPASATLSAGTVTTASLTFRQNSTVVVGTGFAPNVVEVSLGEVATYARLADGTVLQWGGIDAFHNLLVPTPVPSLTNVVQVSAGADAACARKSDHSVACWGTDIDNGALGPNVPAGGTVSVPAAVPAPPAAGPFTSISMGEGHVCALSGTTMTCWGANSGEFGNFSTVGGPNPVVVDTFIGSIYAGQERTCVIDGDANLGCAGRNFEGEMGTGTTSSTPQTFFANVPHLENVVSAAPGLFHTCALRGDGTVVCFGDNQFGELGDGTFTNRPSPVAVAGLTNVVQLVAGANHTCALLQNGTVSCWGKAALLGTGSVTDQATPVVVPGLVNVTAIRGNSSAEHTCAELADHTVRCWGSNLFGQIGNGTQAFANRPTVVNF